MASTDTLIAQLSSDDPVARESAIARLTVIGPRVVDRLIQLATSVAPPTALAASLSVLERIGDPRALRTALELTNHPDVDVAVAAVGVARTFVRRAEGVAAVDRLTATALDRARPAPVRAAAVDALKDLGAKTIAPLMKQLADDPALRLAEPAAMRAQVAASAKAALPALLRLLEDIRERERMAPAAERPHWADTRAALHLLLARRGSTIALYDLREALEEARGPLPVDFVKAAGLVGDASCLEPLAAAYAAAKELFWKKSLADAFRAIVKRAHVTKRHRAVRKALARAPELANTL